MERDVYQVMLKLLSLGTAFLDILNNWVSDSEECLVGYPLRGLSSIKTRWT